MKPKDQHHYVYDASSSGFSYAIDDLKRAISHPKLLFTLVKSSFLTRYRGTVLGGSWIIITTFMLVAGLGILYGQIFDQDIDSYFPFVTVGLIVWGIISGIVNLGSTIFLVSANSYNQTPIPKSLFVLRMLGVNFISFLFKLVVLFGVVFYVGLNPSIYDILLAFLGVAIIFWTGFWFSLIVGTIGTRFRDVDQLVAAVMTIAFFLTPVFWPPDRLGPYEKYIQLNPLHHYVHIVRGPLIGEDQVVFSLIFVTVTSLIVTLVGFLTFGKYARYLSYWN